MQIRCQNLTFNWRFGVYLICIFDQFFDDYVWRQLPYAYIIYFSMGLNLIFSDFNHRKNLMYNLTLKYALKHLDQILSYIWRQIDINVNMQWQSVIIRIKKIDE